MNAQGGLCGICGRPIRLNAPLGANKGASVDHVWPKDRIPKGSSGRTSGNVVATHGICNRRKDNRLPKGCELIWLMAVNARLGLPLGARN